MTIGERIYKYRKQAGLSQEELADKLNVTRQSVSLWETDQTMPSLESMIMLADIFSVSLDELCGTSKDVSIQQSSAPQTECLACVKTEYTRDLYNQGNKLSTKKLYIFSVVFIVLAILWGTSILVSDTNNGALVAPILAVIALPVFVLCIKLLLKKRTEENIKLRPNCVATIHLYQEHFCCEVTSDNHDSKFTVRYSEIKKVINDEKYIFIFYGNNIFPIEKNLPNVNYELILKLLSLPSDVTSQNKRIKALLHATFVLSILAIFLAMLTVTICVRFSPLPEFDATMQEYLWIFYLFLPLPLASTVLGIIYLSQKYKCKKNIIAGGIVCVLILIYGSFTFIFADSITHNFGYVHDIENTIYINLPDSGYLSREKVSDDTINSVAMIKFDDESEIYRTVSSDYRFRTDTRFIPSDFINSYYASITSHYDFFLIFDVTSNKFAVTTNSQEKHRYLFVAYSVSKNILFVLDFVK